MMMKKTLNTTAWAVAILLPPLSVQALDAASLYEERTCIACHGAEGRVPAMDEYPKIAGQPEPYLLAQMKAIKDGTRSNAHSVAMKNVMHLISDEEMEAIAGWLAALPE